MKKVKFPNELDTESTYNVLVKGVFDLYESANRLYMRNEKKLTKSQIYEIIRHTNSKACGICDAIRFLGYEVRNDGGLIVTDEYMNKLFALEQSAKIEMEKENH